MSALGMVLHQSRFEWRAFWRNPAAAFFGAIFPLIFLVIFNLIFGNDVITVPGGSASASTFFVPAIAALSIVNSCFTGVAMGTSISRDGGVLKRVRGTPLPAWAYLAARVLVASAVAVLMVAVVVVAGMLFYDVTLQAQMAPAFLVTLALGSAMCCTLALAVTAIIPNADAAPAVVNVIVMPLLFISDIFIRGDRSPEWLKFVADIFPVRHMSLALQAAFNPFDPGSGFSPGHLAVMAAWLVIGAVLARRFFSWEPRA